MASLAAAGVVALGVTACSESGGGGDGRRQGGQELSGKIAIDGSSTVSPFAQAAAEQFMAENPGVQVTVGRSGTAGGFEKLCAGETEISNASRPIKGEGRRACEKNNVAYEELQVANDGIAVTTNTALPIDCMTTDQLEELWGEDSQVGNYQVVDIRLPNQRVSLYGPDLSSGTFEFFTEEINGEKGDSRSDYQRSDDADLLAQGVGEDKGGLGYFGFSYFEQNQDKLNLVGVDSGEGCVKPSVEAIQSGEYKPLARPLFMYPSKKASKKPEVNAFLRYIAQNHRQIAETAKTVPMSQEQATKTWQKVGGS